MYHFLKDVYRRMLPARVRTFLWRSPLTRRTRERLIRSAERMATHDQIYDRAYYEKAVDPMAAHSAQAIVKSLLSEIRPSSVIDVGCGTGQMLMAFRAQGVKTQGLEYSQAGIDMCRERGLDVKKFDIENDAPPAMHADLVISAEVAEHLPEKCADRYVDLLCSLSDYVFLTAAIPDQTGTDHVNEQPNSYWIEKFEHRGWKFKEPISLAWREQWKEADVDKFYYHSAMLFQRHKGDQL